MSNGDFQVLSLVAAALCQDAQVRLAPSGRRWAWDPENRTILVDLDDLAARGVSACAGIIAHEAGHARVTRGALALGESLPESMVHLLHNALEDPRCERWIASRFPGTQAWLDAARQAFRSPSMLDLPPSLQFIVGAADPASLGEGPLPTAVCGEVTAALQRTRADRRAYCSILPDGDLAGWWDELGTYHPEPGESGIGAAAERALAGPAERVRGTFEALFLADAIVLARAHSHAPDATEEALTGLDWTRLVRLGMRGALPSPQAAAEAAIRLAVRLQGRPPPPGALHRPGPGDDDAEADGHARSAAREENLGRQSPAELARLSAELQRALAPLFPPRRPAWDVRTYEDGLRPRMSSLMRLEANPGASTRVWERRSGRDARSAAVLLLVDLSGSMARGKIGAALDGVQVVVSAPRGLSIPHAVYGFQDELIPALPFGVHAPELARAKVDGLRLEVEGCAPRGHNRPAFNDDGPCVAAAAELLAGRRETDRLLLVVSDGHPEGRRSGAAELHAAVRRWGSPRSPVRLVGVGLGRGATHVSTFYPDAVAGVSPAEFPATLVRVLARRLAA